MPGRMKLMDGRKLANYDLYITNIQLYIRASKLKLKYKEVNMGAYIPSRNLIVIDTDLTDSEEIAIILHELGHALDHVLINKTDFDICEKAYAAVYAEKYTGKQKREVLKRERTAWKYGEAIAKMLRIPLGSWYYACRKVCLDDYRNG